MFPVLKMKSETKETQGNEKKPFCVHINALVLLRFKTTGNNRNTIYIKEVKVYIRHVYVYTHMPNTYI